MSIQYTVQGFKLTTFEHDSPPITTNQGSHPRFIVVILC